MGMNKSKTSVPTPNPTSEAASFPSILISPLLGNDQKVERCSLSLEGRMAISVILLMLYFELGILLSDFMGPFKIILDAGLLHQSDCLQIMAPLELPLACNSLQSH